MRAQRYVVGSNTPIGEEISSGFFDRGDGTYLLTATFDTNDGDVQELRIYVCGVASRFVVTVITCDLARSSSADDRHRPHPASWYRKNTMVTPENLRDAVRTSKLDRLPGNGKHPHYDFNQVEALWPDLMLKPPQKHAPKRE